MPLFRTVAKDPADWEALWSVSTELPMSLDVDVLDRIASVFGKLQPGQARDLCRQYEAALKRLATPEIGAHVQPWPWTGFGAVFSPDRHRYAAERVVGAGLEAFARVLADPRTIAEVPSGPDRTVYQRVHPPLVGPILELLQLGYRRAYGETLPLSIGQPEAYPFVASWRGAPAQYEPGTFDPEAAAIEVDVEPGDVPDHHAGILPAEASRELFDLGRRVWLELDVPPAVQLVSGALIDGAAVCWNALGCPARFANDADSVEISFVAGAGWADEDEFSLGRCVNVVELAALPTDQLRAACTSLAAAAIVDEMDEDQVERPTILELARQYATAVPRAGRERVTGLR